jgi:hypothetical protein
MKCNASDFFCPRNSNYSYNEIYIRITSTKHTSIFIFHKTSFIFDTRFYICARGFIPVADSSLLKPLRFSRTVCPNPGL